MVVVEEVHTKDVEVESEYSSDSEDEMPTLESAEQGGMGAKVNRAEKKARKAMMKLGMTPVEGVFRVSVKRNKSVLFVVTQPEVFKSTSSETYVIFGEAKLDDFGAAAAQAQAAQQFTHAPEVSKVASSGSSYSAALEVDESNIDETGLDQKDLELIMSQVSCSRGKAVAALRAANGDIVEAIMQLSS